MTVDLHPPAALAGTLWLRAEAPRPLVARHLQQVAGRFRAAGWRVVTGQEPPVVAGEPLAVLDDPWLEPLPSAARQLAAARDRRVRWRLPRINGRDGRQGWRPRRGLYTPFEYGRRIRRGDGRRWRARRPGRQPWSGFAVAPADSAAELLAAGWPPAPERLALVREVPCFRYDDPAAHAREELDPFVTDDVGILLDVGCGHGRFAARHQRPGRRVIGIEPDWEVARSAAGRLDLVLPTTAERGLAALAPVVDLAVYADVLEHTLDPGAVLAATARVLAPGGRIVCSLPNNAWAPMVRALAAGRWDPTLAGTQAIDHFVAFTRASFEELAAGCGLEVVERRPVHAPLDWWTRLWAWLAARTAGGRPADLMAMQWIMVLRRRDDPAGQR